MSKFKSPEIEAVVRDASTVRKSIHARFAAVDVQFPHWRHGIDARSVLMAKLGNQMNSVELALIYIGIYLASDDWWKDTYDKPLGVDPIAFLEFTQFVRIGFLHQLVGAIESSSRFLLRQLDATAANGGMAAAHVVYRELYERRLPELRDCIPLLSLLRLTRNSVHNNGIVFLPSGGVEVVEHAGQRYEFAHGRHIEFATWHFLFARASDLSELAVRLVTHPLIARYEELRDPGADPLTS